MNSTQQRGLRAYERKLSSLERKILHACAVFDEPITRTDLLKILRNIKAPLSGIKKPGDLDLYWDHLHSRRLLDQDLMCVRSMQEIVARKAAWEEDFAAMAAYITQQCPARRRSICSKLISRKSYPK